MLCFFFSELHTQSKIRPSIANLCSTTELDQVSTTMWPRTTEGRPPIVHSLRLLFSSPSKIKWLKCPCQTLRPKDLHRDNVSTFERLEMKLAIWPNHKDDICILIKKLFISYFSHILTNKVTYFCCIYTAEGLTFFFFFFFFK